MISWIFAAVALAAVFIATFIGETRRAILALWVAGLAIGGLYLTYGVEMLAIVQWVVSTLVALSFFFFSSMFGEPRAPRAEEARRGLDSKRILMTFFSIVVGVGFAAVIRLGSGALTVTADAGSGVGNDLAALGRELTENHLLSLEVLAFTLFLALVGGGIVARPEVPAAAETPGLEPENRL